MLNPICYFVSKMTFGYNWLVVEAATSLDAAARPVSELFRSCAKSHSECGVASRTGSGELGNIQLAANGKASVTLGGSTVLGA
ncbi:hypothetical protein L1987_05155 [Smallanthus sonchifolius]|uniref:Uncharacterized protein n=1 Tax=Smallanthus sonchifolius TaxID=185202 RepID=A0ACB9JUR4_9ASTR|nr:hypothetical protein L1987_05155 [Smallanthus sonchifolius]